MDRSATRASASTRRAAFAVLLLAFLPWGVLWEGDDVGLVMAWGLFRPSTLHAYPLSALLTEAWPSYRLLPHSLRVWPVGTGLYGLALASAGAGALVRREDPRVTGGLLVLAGIASLWVVVGVAGRSAPGVLAIPLGTVGLWLVAWRWYGSALRDLV